MIYYPLSVLMLASIRDILIVSSSSDVASFRALLGDGASLGLSVRYAIQDQPRGIADALIIGSDHIGTDSVTMILGDNIFHGPNFSGFLQQNLASVDGCLLFGCRVRDPERYGVGEVDSRGRILSIEEKPDKPRSNVAITGLYSYDNDVIEIAKEIGPSARGELEITDVNRTYLERGKARLTNLGRGFAWLDTGTPEALTAATQYVQALETRQGVRIACIEEIAFRMGFIDQESCYQLGFRMNKSAYGQYIMKLFS